MLLRPSMASLKSKPLILMFSDAGRFMIGLDASYSISNGGWGKLRDWSDLSRCWNFVFSINSVPMEFINSSPFSYIVIEFYIWTCVSLKYTSTNTELIGKVKNMIQVGVVRKKDIIQSVKTSIELAGGLKIQKNSTVLIRPNANTADYPPGSTNPEVLKGAIRAVKEYDPAKIIVAEKSMTTLDTIKVMKYLGLYQAAESEGVDEILSFDDVEWKKVRHKDAKSWPHGFSVPVILDTIDYMIALPIVKTHWTALFTMGLKSQISITSDLDRRQLPHGQKNDELFGYMIAEANLVHKPDFYISDATKCFVTDGPNVGTLREPGIVIATSDVIANDVVGLGLLKTLGTIDKIQNRPVWEQPQIKRAVELSLGVKSRKDIQIRSDGVKEIERIEGNIHE